MKGSFTMILSVTLLYLPASWTSASPIEVHTQMDPSIQAYIPNDTGTLNAAKCCTRDYNAINGDYCLLKTHCTNAQWQPDEDTCFTLTPTAYTDKNGQSIYQSCTYSTEDGYCTPQNGPCS